MTIYSDVLHTDDEEDEDDGDESGEDEEEDEEDDRVQVDLHVVQPPAGGAPEVGVALRAGVHAQGPVADLHQADLPHRLQVVERLVHGPQ